MIKGKEGKDMQRISLFCLISAVCVGVANAAYLPVVDVSRGGVSARAAFGEDVKPIAQNNSVSVAPVQDKKRVVARSAKKTVSNNITNGGDILKPNRPRSDLWAKSSDAPLRMPRMDEIAVINSDVMLPEESLDNTPTRVQVARTSEQQISHDEAMNELKKLRAEISRLSAAQKETEDKIARARPMTVRTPISGVADVKPAVKNDSGVNVRREIVTNDSTKNIVARNASETMAQPKIASVKEMSKMSPNELKKAFKKTYLSENKHLSTYPVDDRFDVVSDMSSNMVGFDATSDLSEMDAGVRPMEIKISFLNNDSGLSRENYNLLSETAAIVVNNPKRAVQIAIPESVTQNKDARKLASRRLAIIEQVLRDTGIAERRIVPVLSQRSDDVFVLRVISSDVFESLTEQKRNMFGDSVSKKTYKSMSW